jgi:hypothetical protein
MRNTIRVTCITLISSFIMYIMFLYLTRPNVVKTIDEENKVIIRWSVLVSLSLGLACATAIGVFFYLVNKRNVSGTIYMGNKVKFVPNSNS